MKHNRRNFLQMSSTAVTGVLLSHIEGFALQPQLNIGFPAAVGYELKILATKWGFGGNVNEFCNLVKNAGYDGIEYWWPETEISQKEMFEAVKKHNLDLAIIWGTDESAFSAHATAFKKTVEIFTKQRFQKPIYINLHSGKDYFSFDENIKLVEFTTKLSKETGIPIYHETHRSRMMFAAHITNEFLKKHPQLKLTLDISHWCNVHESLLEDQEIAVQEALRHTDHIHARIGYPEGPQITDPRAPEWKSEVDAHFAWWDKVVEQKKKTGERITFLTEFGPPHYMHTLPYTQQPVSNQWEINLYMMQLLRNRYGV